MAHAARLSSHDRAVIEAFHDYQAGRIDSAERVLRAVAAEYPTDLEARLILAEILFQYAPVRGHSQGEARALFEEVIEADPRFLCIRCRLLNVALVEGDIQRAEFWARQAPDEDVEGGPEFRTIADRFYLAARRGDTTAMRDLAGKVEESGRESPASDLVNILAVGALVSGEFRMGEELLARGEALDAPPVSGTVFRTILHLSRGQYARADQEINALRGLLGPGPSRSLLSTLLIVHAPPSLRLAAHDTLLVDLREWTVPLADDAGDAFPAERMIPATRHYLLGLTLGRVAQGDAALAQADSLDALAGRLTEVGEVVRNMAQTVRADVAGRRGDWAAALEALEPVGRNVPPELLGPLQSAHAYAAELRLAAHLALAEPAGALRWLRFGVRAGDVPRTGHYGHWHGEMARTLHALDREAEAQEHFHRFAEAWSDADPQRRAEVEELRRTLFP